MVPKPSNLPLKLAKYGVDTVFIAEGSELETYNSEYYAQAMAYLIGEKKPEIVLIGHSMQGKDLAPGPRPS